MKLILSPLTLILLVYSAINAFVWPYAINSWLVYCEKEPLIVWWQGILLGFVPGFGQLGIPGAVVTWIIMLFV